MRPDTQRSRYTRLQWRLFFSLAAMIPASLLVFLVLLSLGSGHIANTVVGILEFVFDMEHESAIDWYNQVIRRNGEWVLLALMVLVFLVLVRVALGWFVRYFRQVDEALDVLLCDDGRPFRLSPELFEMERKLLNLRETLERRRLESQLAEQRKNDLVIYLAHDIRTPLTSVIGYLSLLDEAPDMPETQRKRYLHITLQKSHRLETLINEFFEITRYNLQEIILEKQTLDLYYMLAQLTDEFLPQLQDHGNTLQLQVAEELTVYADPDKLARVFNNLLKNAIAYSYPGTPILVRADADPRAVTVRFENRGQTIPPHKLEAIFEKFYRLDEARSTDVAGAGLGLAIAREIVARHGGALDAQSENETTVFTVQLPAANATAPANAVNTTPATNAANTAPGKNAGPQA